MILTTHQPIFLPWPGFFSKAMNADVMVLLDQVQFPLGRSWMTRNRLKGSRGELWIGVPVWRRGKGKQKVRDVEICNNSDWRSKHLGSLRHQYANAPYRTEMLAGLEAIYGADLTRLVDLNIAFIRFLWNQLNVGTRLVIQSDLAIDGQGTDLLVALCRAMNAGAYLTLPPVQKYLDADRFKQAGIRLRFAHFTPPVYPQLWGDFRYNLSTLDLLLNCGPKGTGIVTQSVTRISN